VRAIIDVNRAGRQEASIGFSTRHLELDSGDMKGLELSRQYFLACREAIASAFPDLYPRMAIGLIGHGSQCLRLDDSVSRDHDWGPQFCVFLDKSDFGAHGADLQAFLEKLPNEFGSYPVEWDRRVPKERSGVLCTQAWFREQLGRPVPFSDVTDWLATSDPKLLWVTNGEIWHDPLGHVSTLRGDLAYYPPEVWLRKVVNKCLLVQILGPYQMQRALQRGETLLPFFTRSYFVREALHLVFLLNERYAPFFKWLFPVFSGLPNRHGLEVVDIGVLLREPDAERLLEQVNAVADHLHEAVRGRFPDLKGSTNLLEVGFQLFDRIENPAIREMPFWNQEVVV
jgi:hypothetical protein